MEIPCEVYVVEDVVVAGAMGDPSLRHNSASAGPVGSEKGYWCSSESEGTRNGWSIGGCDELKLETKLQP